MTKMKIWLDDVRQPPDASWEWHQEIIYAWQVIRNGLVSEVSLDHDLGDEQPTGYDLLKWIEESLMTDKIDKDCVPTMTIHSANPVGRKNMELAIENIKKLCIAKGKLHGPE